MKSERVVKTFVIPVRDLTSSGESVDFAVSAKWLGEALVGCDLRPDREGRLSARASTAGRDVFVRGAVEVEVAATCVRCLDPAPLRIRGEIERLFVAPAVLPPRTMKKARGSEEDEDEEVPDDVEAYDGEEVVLDGAVREQILLEIPMNPLCREDCPGLSAGSSPTGSTGPFKALASIVLPKKE